MLQLKLLPKRGDVIRPVATSLLNITGLAGTLYFMMDLLKPIEARFPAFQLIRYNKKEELAKNERPSSKKQKKCEGERNSEAVEV